MNETAKTKWGHLIGQLLLSLRQNESMDAIRRAGVGEATITMSGADCRSAKPKCHDRSVASLRRRAVQWGEEADDH